LKKSQENLLEPLSLASSTKMISCRDDLGDLSITLVTVRKSVENASLWKTMMTEVVGNFAGYSFTRQLKFFSFDN
jgi:hypothetical protein